MPNMIETAIPSAPAVASDWWRALLKKAGYVTGSCTAAYEHCYGCGMPELTHETIEEVFLAWVDAQGTAKPTGPEEQEVFKTGFKRGWTAWWLAHEEEERGE